MQQLQEGTLLFLAFESSVEIEGVLGKFFDGLVRLLFRRILLDVVFFHDVLSGLREVLVHLHHLREYFFLKLVLIEVAARVVFEQLLKRVLPVDELVALAVLVCQVLQLGQLAQASFFLVHLDSLCQLTVVHKLLRLFWSLQR